MNIIDWKAVLWCLAAYGFVKLFEEGVTSVIKTVRRMIADKYEFKAHIKEMELKGSKEKPEIKGFRQQD